MDMIAFILLACAGFNQVSSQSGFCPSVEKLDSDTLGRGIFSIQDTRVVEGKVKSSKMIRFWARMNAEDIGNQAVFNVRSVTIKTTGSDRVSLECFDSDGDSEIDTPVSGRGWQTTTIRPQFRRCNKLLVKVKKSSNNDVHSVKGFSMKSCLVAPSEPTSACPEIDVTPPLNKYTFNSPDLPLGPGSYIEFNCSTDLPYNLVGSAMTTCVMNGSTAVWDNTAPVCERITCPGREATLPLNQSVIDSDVAWGTGTRMDYTCQSGYYMTGFTSVTCDYVLGQEVGEWSGPEPNCTRITCAAIIVSSPLRSFVIHADERWATGTTVLFHCDTGYYIIGSVSVTCEAFISGGRWSDTLPTCERITCDAINVSSPLNVITDPTDEDWALGKRVQFTCDDGYYRLGSRYATCQVFGFSIHWSHSPPTCERITCPSREAVWPLFQDVTQEDPFVDWATDTEIYYTCDFDYYLSGSSYVTCYDVGDEFGEWGDPEPTCEKITCSSREAVWPLSMDVTQSDPDLDWAIDTDLYYTCEYGYYLSGESSQYCYDGGEVGAWTYPEPTCIRITCSSRDSVLPLIASVEHTDDVQWGSDTEIYYRCESGYVIAGSDFAICRDEGEVVGEWSNDEPTCIRITCPSREEVWPLSMSVSQADVDIPWALGTDMDYSCEYGYYLSGESYQYCFDAGDEGAWSNPEPTCTRITCSSRPAVLPLIGSVADSDGAISLAMDSEIYYSCDTGYYISGSDYVTCDDVGAEFGEWSDDEPSCIRITCPSKVEVSPLSMSVTQADPLVNWATGTGVYYTCDFGYYVSGLSYVECYDVGDEVGEWSNPEPTCERIICPSREEVWPLFMDVTQAELDVDWVLGTELDYSCERGYYLSGESYQYCYDRGDVGAWSDPIPTCTRVTCPSRDAALPLMDSVSHDDVPWGSDTSIFYSCDSGYILTGSEYVTCEDVGVAVGQWSDDEPTCISLG